MNVQVGQVVSIERVFVQDDFDRFAALSGDDNPIHVDAEFAARTAFGKTVAHGMLLYGAVCGVLGTRLTGLGTVQLEQELMFPNPTYVGEQVVIRLEVTEFQPDEGLADLTTVITTKPDGGVGLQGRTFVRLPGSTTGSGDPFGAKKTESRSSRIVISGDPAAGSGDPLGANLMRAKSHLMMSTPHLMGAEPHLAEERNPVFL